MCDEIKKIEIRLKTCIDTLKVLVENNELYIAKVVWEIYTIETFIKEIQKLLNLVKN